MESGSCPGDMISHTTEHSVITQPTRNNRPLVVASFDKVGFHTSKMDELVIIGEDTASRRTMCCRHSTVGQ